MQGMVGQDGAESGRVMSCGRVGLFPHEPSSFQQGTEYPVELL